MHICTHSCATAGVLSRAALSFVRPIYIHSCILPLYYTMHGRRTYTFTRIIYTIFNRVHKWQTGASIRVFPYSFPTDRHFHSVTNLS